MAESRQAEISRLELLFAAHPEGRVFTHLAEAYRRAGEPERARVLLETGLARHADYASAHVVHGRVLLDLGLEAEAEAAFRRVLRLDPENLVALRALGDLARRAGRPQDALSYYEQLRARDPSNQEVEEIVADLSGTLGIVPPPGSAEPAVTQEQVEEGGAAVAVEAWADDAETPSAAGVYAPDDAPAAEGGLDDGPAAAGPDEAHPVDAPADATREGAPADEPEPSVIDEPGPVWGDPTAAPAWEEPGSPPAWDEPSPLIAPEEPEAPPPAEPEDSAAVEETAAAAPAALDPLDVVVQAAAEPAGPADAGEPAGPIVVDFDAAPPDAVPADDAALLGGEMVTETLADLYLSQGLAERAAELYRALLVARPGDPRLTQRLEQALASQPQNGQPAAAAGAGAGATPADHVPPEPADEEEAAGADRLAEVESAWTGRAGLGPESVSPYTWQEEQRPAAQDEAPEPTIRGYFDRLMDWEPSQPGEPVGPADEPLPEPARPAAAADEFDTLFTPVDPAQALPAPELSAPAAGPEPTESAAAAPEPTAASGALVGLADLLIGLLEYQDPAMPGGSSLVRQVATAIGRELGLADPALRSLALASVLQGLGSLALRQRSGADDADARRSIDVTLDLLEGLDLPTGVREAIRYAHHRWDGADGVEPAGAAIPLPARILSVARDFAAALAPSAVAHSRRVGAALDELKREGGRRYDPAVVAVLVRLVGSQARVGFGLRHHVLIVHRHSPTAAVLAARLRSSGYLPEAVDDVARAWDRLAAAPADALLLADDVDDGDVVRFLTRLREDARLGAIPVLVAGADGLERRVELLNAGADICFPPGVSFNELRATLTALLRRAARPGAAVAAARKAAESARRYALQGDLVDFPLSWLLDILGFDGRTAVISVSTADDEGTIHVERGAPRHAETRSRYGEAALRHMLRWRHGTFSVHLDAPPAPHTIHRSVMELLVADGLTPDGGGTAPKSG